MDSALGWIGQIVSWIGQFCPRWQVLHPAEAAVKVIGFSFRWRKYPGVRMVTKRRGIVVWWPAVTALHTWPVAQAANNLQAQTIVTTDGKTFIVAGMISFEIEDVERIVCDVWDADDTIRDHALAAIHDACIQFSAEELLAASRNGKLDTAMRQEVRTRLKPLGVKVLSMRLTDLAPGRVLRLVSSQPTERGLGG